MSAAEGGQGRIGLAIGRWFPAGGKQRSFLRIARELLHRGHQVTAYVARWEGPEIDGLRVVRLDCRGASNHARQLSFSRELAGHRNEVDLMVGFDLAEGLDLYYAGDPCFVARYRAEKSVFRRLTPRFRGFARLERAVFSPESFTEIMLIAHGEKDRFQAEHGTEDERFHLLPPGIDLARLEAQGRALPARDDFIRSLGLDPADGLIVMVGSSFRTKGVDRAIESLAVLPRSLGRYFSLAVVGEGDRHPFEILARRLGIAARVVFTGPRDDVRSFYAHAELLVHPARVENTGTSILEAMCCGLPVLVTENCGFAQHVLRAGAGLVAPHPFDKRIFDRLLLEALFSPRRGDWAAAGPAHARREDLGGLIVAVADLVEQQLAQARSRA
ncbi:MAG: glycosyltransferase family 4 protein [Planctomycetes bacterium]|nr:glycosyltransferase family 4 protein [Planctomycetota bacterium]